MPIAREPIEALRLLPGGLKPEIIYTAVIEAIDWSRVQVTAQGEHLRRGPDHVYDGAVFSVTGHPQDVCIDCIRTVLLHMPPGSVDPVRLGVQGSD